MSNLKLLMGRPIVLDKDKDIVIRQPSMEHIVDIGEDAFNEMVLPYILTVDSVFNGIENEEELSSKFHIFDLFFTEVEGGNTILDNIFDGRNSLEVLQESMEYFFDTDDIRVLHQRKKIIVKNSYLIDNNEFDRIRKIIQSIVGRKEIEVEKAPKNMTKRQKDIWKKLQKGRRRTAEKNAIYYQDIINYVMYGGKSYIPSREIDRMTYYQLQNAYKSIIGVDAFSIGMGYKLSQKFDVKEDVKHWTDSLKIGK